jgi:hypothetical protein
MLVEKEQTNVATPVVHRRREWLDDVAGDLADVPSTAAG